MPVPSLSGVIDIDRTAPVLLNRQLYDRLRSAIADGRLRPGYRLPSSRSLAGELRRIAQHGLVGDRSAGGGGIYRRRARTAALGRHRNHPFPGARRQSTGSAREAARLCRPGRDARPRRLAFAAKDAPRPFVPGLADWRRSLISCGAGSCAAPPATVAGRRRHQPPGTAGRPGAAPGRSSRGQDDARADHRHTVGAGRDRAGQSHHAQCRRRRLARGPRIRRRPRRARGRGARIVGVPLDRSGLTLARSRSRPRLIFVTPSHQYPDRTADVGEPPPGRAALRGFRRRRPDRRRL